MLDSLIRGVQVRFPSDRTGVLILGFLAMWLGVSYFPPLIDPGRAPAHWLEGILPPPVWGVIWMGAGVGCLVAAWWDRLAPVGIGMVVGLHAAWAVSFVFATLVGDAPRAWVSSRGYVAVVLLAVWALARQRARPVVHGGGE